MSRFIHNKDIASTLLIVNESRLLGSKTTPPLPTIDTTITIRYKDVDIVPLVQEECTKWMKSHPDMLAGATCKCSLNGFNMFGPEMSIKATLKREASSRKAQVITEVLLYIENCVRKNGGFLAVEEGVEFPPSLKA